MPRGGAQSRISSRVAVLGTGLALLAPPTFARPPAKASNDGSSCFDAYESVQELKGAERLLEAKSAASACSATACPREIRESCAEWLREVDGSVPTLVVTLRDENGVDVRPEHLAIDGTEVASSEVGKPLERNPGSHLVEARAPDGQSFRSEVTLVAGEKRRLVSFTLVPPKASGEEKRLGWTSPLFLSGGGLFLAGAAVATIGTVKRFEVENCRPNCDAGALSNAHNWLTVADVGFAAASIGLGGALLFLFLDTETKPKVSAGVTPSGFAATYAGSF